MLEMLKKRREEQEGFTLIELMVVVLIIGIMLAIAVPTFLNAQKNAKAKQATSNLREGLSAAKTVYSERQTYTGTSATLLKAAEPSLSWAAGAVDEPHEVSFAVDATGEKLGLSVRSKQGYCYYIIDDVSEASGGTTYARSNATVTPATGCTAVATAPVGSATNGATPEQANW